VQFHITCACGLEVWLETNLTGGERLIHCGVIVGDSRVVRVENIPGKKTCACGRWYQLIQRTE